jgi:hypothetical protein
MPKICSYETFFSKQCVKKYVGNNYANVYMHILRKELEFSGSDIDKKNSMAFSP